MTEIEVKGHSYRVGKLNAIQQFHVARRLGPALIVAGVSIEMLRNGMNLGQEKMLAMVGPVMDVISKMPDEEVEYVLYTCLGVVQRGEGGKWAQVLASVGGGRPQIMYETLELPELIELCVAVLQENLANFLLATPDAKS